ncbi:hypothetical protein SCUP515_06477 [Seiridium cupressi]
MQNYHSTQQTHTTAVLGGIELQGPGSTDRNFAELNGVIACLPVYLAGNARTRHVSRHWLLPKISDVIPAAPIRTGLARAAERHKKPNAQENSTPATLATPATAAAAAAATCILCYLLPRTASPVARIDQVIVQSQQRAIRKNLSHQNGRVVEQDKVCRAPSCREAISGNLPGAPSCQSSADPVPRSGLRGQNAFTPNTYHTADYGRRLVIEQHAVACLELRPAPETLPPLLSSVHPRPRSCRLYVVPLSLPNCRSSCLWASHVAAALELPLHPGTRHVSSRLSPPKKKSDKPRESTALGRLLPLYRLLVFAYHQAPIRVTTAPVYTTFLHNPIYLPKVPCQSQTGSFPPGLSGVSDIFHGHPSDYRHCLTCQPMTVHIYLPTMEPGQSELKRPRLNGPTSPWTSSSHPGPVLPPPQPSQHHPPSLSPYQSHNPYARQHQEHAPHPSHHHPDERRHHEPDSYPPHPPPPMQDHRPPPSPAHPPHAPFGPYRRESIVKRESGDDTPLPHMRRPNSTGTVPESLPPPTQGPPQYPGPHMDSHRRPPSFDNGGSMPPSPQVYRQPPTPYHQPPTPIAQHNQYEPTPPGYGPPSSISDMYSNLPVASAKRKAQRASQVGIFLPFVARTTDCVFQNQACDNCRQLKAKCDEQRPCKNCKDKSLACVYRDLPTKQPDKVSADILELMSSLKDQIASQFERLDQRMSRIEHNIRPADQSSDMKLESVEGDHQDYDVLPAGDHKETGNEHPSSPRDSDDPDKVKTAHEIIRQMDNDEIEIDPGPPVNPGQPSLPANHTTLAALLLKWPSIDHLVCDLLRDQGIQHISEFPVSQELQRGVLRVWGRGEGYMLGKHHETKGGPIMTDVTEDSPNEAPSPYSDREGWTDGQAWGTVGVPPTQGVDVYKGGMLLSDINMELDRPTVKQYVQSFKDNVLNMHPILIPRQLDAMVAVFLDSLPQAPSKSSNKIAAKFVQSGGSSIAPPGPETGSKRKRSPAVEEQTPTMPFQKAGIQVARSINSALVLSVLALGKICLHKGKIPELVPDHDNLQASSSPFFRNGVMSSPSQGSPPGFTPNQTSQLPSPKEIDRSLSSRRASVQGSNSTVKGQNLKRNIDVVPGLDYLGLAEDIIGGNIGGFTLKHVYVELFLGLYYGQLGRVIESWSHIQLAGRNLQVVLRPSLSRLSEMKRNNQAPQSGRDNQLAFAFWTCLQLERYVETDGPNIYAANKPSDILAELPMPHSGILTYEEAMPYPNLDTQVNGGYDEKVLISYQAQLWVRRQLNQVHNKLYGLDSSDDMTVMEKKMNELQAMLTKSIWVPRQFQFSDDEPPAPEILAARLRAKYWGSQVILYRKYIDMILHDQRLPDHAYRGPPPHRSDWEVHNIDQQYVRAPPGMDPRALNYARLGITALIESTRAFHGLDRNHRILVTNVFTTAHAQWGNLLVLSACYTHQVLRQFINGELLQELFSRTVDFFKLISHSTSPLKTDMNILSGLYQKLGLSSNNGETGVSSSFSSMASSGHVSGQTPGDKYHPGTPNMPPPAHVA